MITVERKIYTEEFKKVKVFDGEYFLNIIEDGVPSSIKLELNEDNSYKFTRVVNNTHNMAIIYKEGNKELPWILEKYFTGVVDGNLITEEEFENNKSEILKTL